MRVTPQATSFTGKLTPEQAKKLIEKNWTIPMGVNSTKLKQEYYEINIPNFAVKLKNFFKNLLKK